MAKERQDYTGPLQPEIPLSEFSKDFLLKIMKLWGEMWETHNAEVIKIGSQMEGVGPAKAGEIVTTSLEHIAPPIMRKIADICKVDINTIEGRIKAGRFIPDNMPDHYTKPKFEILSDTEATLTYDRCYLADNNLIGGGVEGMRYMCGVIEPRGAMTFMNYPGERKVKTTMLKIPDQLPPKKGEPCCIWHFKLED